MDTNTIRRLLAGFAAGKREAAPAAAASGVDEVRPWDSPVLRDPSMRAVPRELLQREGITPTSPGAVQPADDALVQAILRRAINQEFARAGGQPVPR